jgi:hypothetical protein
MCPLRRLSAEGCWARWAGEGWRCVVAGQPGWDNGHRRAGDTRNSPSGRHARGHNAPASVRRDELTDADCGGGARRSDVRELCARREGFVSRTQERGEWGGATEMNPGWAVIRWRKLLRGSGDNPDVRGVLHAEKTCVVKAGRRIRGAPSAVGSSARANKKKKNTKNQAGRSSAGPLGSLNRNHFSPTNPTPSPSPDLPLVGRRQGRRTLADDRGGGQAHSFVD